MEKKLEKELEESWNRYRVGENQALKSVYNEYYFMLLIQANKYLNNQEKAKDAVHDTFLKFFNYDLKRRENLPVGKEVNLKAYFLVAVKNKCLDALRKEKDRREKMKTTQTSIIQLFTRSIVEESFVEANYKEMLGVLPLRQRQILQLHIEGYKNDEIATTLNISYNTVRNTISTSKTKIKALWSTFMD